MPQRAGGRGTGEARRRPAGTRNAGRAARAFGVSLLSVGALAALLPACGGSEGPREFAVVLDPRTPALKGFLTLTGAVTLPQTVPVGTRGFVGISRGRPTTPLTFEETAQADAPIAAGTLVYRVVNLAEAEAYTLFVGVDTSGDGRLGPGDLGGYFDGTTVTPFADPALARTVRVFRNLDDLDFGIGPLP